MQTRAGRSINRGIWLNYYAHEPYSRVFFYNIARLPEKLKIYRKHITELGLYQKILQGLKRCVI